VHPIISGLLFGMLVVEAGTDSDALITMHYALGQNRDVFAIPGAIFSPKSIGSNQLIRDQVQVYRGCIVRTTSSSSVVMEAYHTAHPNGLVAVWRAV
jgi:hypothetical protein